MPNNPNESDKPREIIPPPGMEPVDLRMCEGQPQNMRATFAHLAVDNFAMITRASAIPPKVIVPAVGGIPAAFYMLREASKRGIDPKYFLDQIAVITRAVPEDPSQGFTVISGGKLESHAPLLVVEDCIGGRKTPLSAIGGLLPQHDIANVVSFLAWDGAVEKLQQELRGTQITAVAVADNQQILCGNGLNGGPGTFQLQQLNNQPDDPDDVRYSGEYDIPSQTRTAAFMATCARLATSYFRLSPNSQFPDAFSQLNFYKSLIGPEIPLESPLFYLLEQIEAAKIQGDMNSLHQLGLEIPKVMMQQLNS
ncbi:hypothetical protein KBD81_03865 [Candidatus Woesebacteria bacterium]|nr:hypothetical protein [Candidatus Woesebacteria bacterium]